MSAETWYVMEDGSCGDPREVAVGRDGKLRHKDGRAVAYAPHGPRSRSIDPAAERAKAAATAAARKSATASIAAASEARELTAGKAVSAAADREMKPAAGKTYQTRGSKAD